MCHLCTKTDRRTVVIRAEEKIIKKNQISFCEILRNKNYYARIQPKRFHFNGNTIGFLNRFKVILGTTIKVPGESTLDGCSSPHRISATESKFETIFQGSSSILDTKVRNTDLAF